MNSSPAENPVTQTHAICFDKELVERYGGRGPRYTSYPTALQFDENFGARDYEHIARDSNSSATPLSLYVHIPFCKSLCYYCACNKIVTRNDERVANYMQCLAQEIRLQSVLFDRGRRVEQLHFGGGTPTYLDENQMRSLMKHLRRAFNFDESEAREFSIEVDPRSVDTRSMEILAELGFNRLSLGVQDFDPAVQIAVNRVQSVEDVATLTDNARTQGFRSISFDLIYGLPHQSVSTFDRTLDQVLEMRPDRLAIYNYAHLPARFKGQRMINDADIPTPEAKLNILQHTIDKLGRSDYVYVGMDHFALPGDDLVTAQEDGTLQRNFQGYSTHGDSDLIGLGVSAISNIGNSFSQNLVSTGDYESALQMSSLPIQRGIVVDHDDQLRAAVIQQLMCHDRLGFAEFNERFDLDFASYFAPELEQMSLLADDGLVAVNEAEITISPKGRLLLRSIGMVFDRYLNSTGDNGRYSKAI